MSDVRLWQGFREGARRRGIASGVGREYFDEVLAGTGAVNDARAAGTNSRKKFTPLIPQPEIPVP
jgi:hypothetical protein